MVRQRILFGKDRFTNQYNWENRTNRMRLRQYITEGYKVGHKTYQTETEGWMDWTANEWPKVKKQLRKDCGPWLNAIKGCYYKAAFRGVSNVDITKDLAIIKAVRQNRKPLDTRRGAHDALDRGFEKAFGWKPRSQAMFIINDYSVAQAYGTPYLVFPVGKFRFLWSDDISDLYGGIQRHPDVVDIDPLISAAALKKLYSEDDLCGALKSGGEIMVGCKYYRAISTVVVREFRDITKSMPMSDPKYDGEHYKYRADMYYSTQQYKNFIEEEILK